MSFISREVGHVQQKDRGLHHPGHVAAAGPEDGPQALHDPGGLFPDAAVDHLAAGGIERDLAGGEDQSARHHPWL